MLCRVFVWKVFLEVDFVDIERGCWKKRENRGRLKRYLYAFLAARFLPRNMVIDLKLHQWRMNMFNSKPR